MNGAPFTYQSKLLNWRWMLFVRNIKHHVMQRIFYTAKKNNFLLLIFFKVSVISDSNIFLVYFLYFLDRLISLLVWQFWMGNSCNTQEGQFCQYSVAVGWQHNNKEIKSRRYGECGPKAAGVTGRDGCS